MTPVTGIRAPHPSLYHRRVAGPGVPVLATLITEHDAGARANEALLFGAHGDTARKFERALRWWRHQGVCSCVAYPGDCLLRPARALSENASAATGAGTALIAHMRQ